MYYCTCCADPATGVVPWNMPNILFTTLGFSKSVELKCKLPMISTHTRFTIHLLTREIQVKIDRHMINVMRSIQH